MKHALDDALNELHGYGYELNNGLTNHAPMVAQTLHQLGLDSAIAKWVHAELPRCLLRPKHVEPIDPNHWLPALSDPSRFSDWSSFFLKEIDNLGWRATVQLWVMRFAPGFISGAAHGVIRCGHAVRSLSEEETPTRSRELADALASWACEYSELPNTPGPCGQHSPSAALATTPQVEAAQKQPQGAITQAMQLLRNNAAFADHFTALDVNDDLLQLSLDIAATFARLFCQSAQTPLGAIVFTHGITGIAATCHLGPLLTYEQHKILLQHAFHSGCALHAVYSAKPYATPVLEPLPLAAQECIYDALEHGDEHVIKLTEACVEFDVATADAFFLTAAEQARRLLPKREALV